MDYLPGERVLELACCFSGSHGAVVVDDQVVSVCLLSSLEDTA